MSQGAAPPVPPPAVPEVTSPAPQDAPISATRIVLEGPASWEGQLQVSVNFWGEVQKQSGRNPAL